MLILLKSLRKGVKFPKEALLVTADVTGLYPSIPHKSGLDALQKALDKIEKGGIPAADLVSMADFVLKNNYFEFGTEKKHQISGTAIGTKFPPPYACIFMDRVETEINKPWMWDRYIDDIFSIWTHGRDKLIKFLERLNCFHPNLKFTYEISETKVNFLDLLVSLEGNELVTDLYCKSTDGHQYLHYESRNPIHTKRSAVYSQALRIRRICTKEKDSEKHLQELRSWFENRNYPEKLITEQLKKATDMSRESLLATKNVIQSKGVPLVMDYSPSIRILYELFPLLHLEEESKRVFTHRPFVSFRNHRNLASYLVRAKVGS